MSLARFAFQACAIDRSAISPFRISYLQPLPGPIRPDCDKSSKGDEVTRGIKYTVTISARGLTQADTTSLAPSPMPHVRYRNVHAFDKVEAGEKIRGSPTAA